ncbi:rod-binding protein [Sphingomonas montana]|uniref:rod-binding protein n=1 Tax=Sphingomonas montana TaxID=1843236 RepID=UPI0009FB7C1A|nr:rod-binding protein [Sphingomonas montana]
MTTISNTTPAAGTSAANVSLAAQKDGLAKVAKQFEAVFLRQIIGSMRQASLAEGALDSSASAQFRDMQDGRLADSMTDAGGFGVAQMLLKQFDANPASAAGLVAPAPAAPVPPTPALPE